MFFGHFTGSLMMRLTSWKMEVVKKGGDPVNSS